MGLFDGQFDFGINDMMGIGLDPLAKIMKGDIAGLMSGIKAPSSSIAVDNPDRGKSSKKGLGGSSMASGGGSWASETQAAGAQTPWTGSGYAGGYNGNLRGIINYAIPEMQSNLLGSAKAPWFNTALSAAENELHQNMLRDDIQTKMAQAQLQAQQIANGKANSKSVGASMVGPDLDGSKLAERRQQRFFENEDFNAGLDQKRRMMDLENQKKMEAYRQQMEYKKALLTELLGGLGGGKMQSVSTTDSMVPISIGGMPTTMPVRSTQTTDRSSELLSQLMNLLMGG